MGSSKKQFAKGDHVQFICPGNINHEQEAVIEAAAPHSDCYDIRLKRGGRITIVSSSNLLRITRSAFKNHAFTSRMLRTI